MRVFISSTCYDLIDLRAELEVFFRSAGVEPVLSDSLTSDFQVLSDQNSIETCLANVRSCDEFLIILSNRYGPSLAKAGLNDFSATHLEYNEAVAAKKPVRMFVRDRLEGDYSTWRQNSTKTDLRLSWCKKEDWRLFELLKIHRDLSETDAKSNWFWTFRNSVELKQHLTKDFQEPFARVTVQRLFERGRVPFLQVTPKLKGFETGGVHFDMRIRNLSDVVAVAPVFEFEGDNYKHSIQSLAGGEEICFPVKWGNITGQNLDLRPRLSYSILEGHKFIDEAELTVRFNAQQPEKACAEYKLKQRRYTGASLEMTLIDPTKNPATSNVL
jgi:hypothetical protein